MAFENLLARWGSAFKRLPIFARHAMNGSVLMRCAGASRLAEITTPCVYDATEMLSQAAFYADLDSYLLSDDGQRLLRQLRIACVKRVSVWVAEVDRDTARKFSHLLGTDCVLDASLHALPASELGVRPWALSPSRLLCDLLARLPHLSARVRTLVAQQLEGMDSTHMNGAVRSALRLAGIPLFNRSWLGRTLLNPIFWTYVVVLIYSTLRVLPVSLVDEFQGSLAVLWALDVGTAIPYTWGMLAMLTARTASTRAVGIVTATVTFVAPYVYFALAGEGYPGYVVVIVLAFILGGVGLEGYKFWHEYDLRQCLERARVYV